MTKNNVAKRGVRFCSAQNFPESTGIYVIVPSWSRSLVKVGQTKDMRKRFGNYCHCFPNGFNVLAFAVYRKNSKLAILEKSIFQTLRQANLEQLPAFCGHRTKTLEWFRVNNVRTLSHAWRQFINKHPPVYQKDFTSITDHNKCRMH